MPLLQLAVLAIWLICFVAAWLLEYAPHASLWFPPAAVTFAALLVLGWRILPVLWLACLLATLMADFMYEENLSALQLLGSGVVFAVTHTFSYGVIALILRRLAQEASPVVTLRKVTWFLLGGSVAAGLAALLGAYGLSVTGMIAVADVPPLLVPWWIGDYAGLVTLGPLIGMALTRLAQSWAIAVPMGVQRFGTTAQKDQLFPRAFLKLGLLLGFSYCVLLAAAWFPMTESIIFLLFLAVVIQLWVVHSESELDSLLGLALFSLLLAAATGLLNLSGQALMMQFIVISMAANSYLGLAVPALYRANRRLRQLLTHDPLTGALTRTFFEDSARAGIRNALELGQPAVLIMVDLDKLKQINDEHGHAIGDRALVTLARICAQNLRPGQILGRLSGDEFAMFLPQTSPAEARQMIHSMSAELDESPPVAGSEPIQASFGMAELNREHPDYDSLLATADEAMYADKRTELPLQARARKHQVLR
jgi:diguanylate cyclase (GGDEF)-like protein